MPELNKHKIFWHSRRGMLELDLLLVPFAQDKFETLSEPDQQLYAELLTHEDQDLWLWLLGQSDPSDSRLSPIIAQILAHNKKQTTL
ncbi:MAG: succinate dehydrogenase assembly factor 2 [Pseudohongiellaceae bacterium]